MSTLDDEVPPTPLNAQAENSTLRSNSFPHQPTTSAAVQSFIDTSKPALNSVPIELDSTPLDLPTEGQKGGIFGKVKEVIGSVKEKVGEGVSKGDKSKNDPAVLNGPVDEPAAEDFEAVQGEDELANSDS
jgi:hypothetical protein